MLNIQLPTIRRASRESAKLRMALIGPSGSGKTFSALAIATELVAPFAENGDAQILVIDTEHGSASKYAQFGFDVMELTDFDPLVYVEAIEQAQANDYKLVIIDSLSHAWNGRNGAIEQVDNAAKRQNGNSFSAWRDVTPKHNRLIDTIVSCKMHVIATMRAKTEYLQEKDPKTGRTSIRKVGLAPVQRDGMEYEFDIVADMDNENNFIVTKSRCVELSTAVINRPGADVAGKLKLWLMGDAQKVVPQRAAPAVEPQEPLLTEDEVVEYGNLYLEAVTGTPLETKPQVWLEHYTRCFWESLPDYLKTLTVAEATTFIEASAAQADRQRKKSKKTPDEIAPVANGNGMTESQKEALHALGARAFGRKSRDIDLERFSQRDFKKPFEQLAKAEASKLIASLKELVNGRPTEAPPTRKTNRLARLFAVSEAAGLPLEELNRLDRINATNQFLTEVRQESAVNSWNELSDVQIPLLAVEIEEGRVSWA